MKKFFVALFVLMSVVSFGKLAPDSWLAPYKEKIAKDAKDYPSHMVLFVWDREEAAPMSDIIAKSEEYVALCGQNESVKKSSIIWVVANAIINPEYKTVENGQKVGAYLKASGEYGYRGIVYLYISGNTNAGITISDAIPAIEWEIKNITNSQYTYKHADKLVDVIINNINEMPEETAKKLLNIANRQYSKFLLVDKENWTPILVKIRTTLLTF